VTSRDEVLDVRVRRHVVDAHLVLPLRPGEVTVLIGPSGAGKTTLLRAVAGLDPLVDGHVRAGEDVWDDGRRHVPTRHRHVGYVSQSGDLLPHLDARGNVAFGLHRIPRRDRAAQASRALEAVGALDLADRPVAGLSGGERQRVALARALAPEPRLLLLDEPLSALDAPTRVHLRVQVRAILADVGVPTLLVTHDRTEALALADRVVVLVDGTVRQVGPPTEVYDRPADADVAALVGAGTVVAGHVVRVQDGLAQVAAGGLVLTGLTAGPGQSGQDEPLAAGDPVLVRIRADEVVLAADRGAGPAVATSARNVLHGTVSALAAAGALVRVDVDCSGLTLTALVTHPSVRDLALAPGTRVVASVKAPAVELVPRRSTSRPAP
jgi:molybdate transport system ATP-binding protein